MLFKATALSLTGKNLDLLWASLYADDTGPLARRSKIVELQEALDAVAKWCAEKGVKFHLSGSKKPVYVAYLKKGQQFPETFDNLNLCGTKIERVNQIKSLGLNWRVRPFSCKNPSSCNNLNQCECNKSGENFGRNINKYGYECFWESKKYKSIAERMQRIRDMVSPEFSKSLVMYYFCGYIRFSSSLIWLRSDKKHRAEVRFYYCMAMAACLGFSTLEALSLINCKNRSVSEDCKFYLKLLQQTGLPSLYEMATLDAVSVTRQLQGICPEWYRKRESQRVAQSEKWGGIGHISGVAKEYNGKLIDQLFGLAQAYISKFRPLKRKIESLKDKIREQYHSKKLDASTEDKIKFETECREKVRSVDAPYLERFYQIRELCKTGNKVNHRHCFSTFMLSSRLEFDCLDTLDRINNFKTPMRVSNQTISQNQSSTPIARRTRTTRLSERQKRPQFSDSPLARSDGESRSKISKMCDFRLDSWKNNEAFCKFCSKKFVSTSNKCKSHLLYECTKVPNSTPINKTLNNRERPLAIHKRLAEIAAHFDPGGL